LGELGLTAARLSETARHMAAAKAVLDNAMVVLADAAVTQVHGDLLIARAAFDAAAPETRTRLLARALMWVSGNPYRPRFAALSALAGSGVGTLHGCQVVARSGRIRVFREFQAVHDITCKSNGLWDGRWEYCGPHKANLTVRALGREGAKLCKGRAATGLPHLSLIASPAVWQDGTLIAAPLAGLENGWRAKLAQTRADFVESLITH